MSHVNMTDVTRLFLLGLPNTRHIGNPYSVVNVLLLRGRIRNK